MTFGSRSLICFVVFASAFTLAQSVDPAVSLKLLPAPKEVRLGDGSFTISSSARIIDPAKGPSEDRTAIEMLRTEIEHQGGPKVPVENSNEIPKTGAIVLGRLSDPAVRAELESKGLKAEKGLDEQGYLIYADKSRIVVAGASAQGLFYGVQTLRQLIRPQGRELICPAVAIRDWPSMRWRGAQDDISRGPIPTWSTKRSRFVF